MLLHAPPEIYRPGGKFLVPAAAQPAKAGTPCVAALALQFARLPPAGSADAVALRVCTETVLRNEWKGFLRPAYGNLPEP